MPLSLSLLLLCVALPSLAVAWAAGFVVRQMAVRLDFVDRPGERKNHERAIPLGGGLAIWLGVVTTIGLLTVFAWLAPDRAEDATWLPPEVLRHLPGLRAKLGDLWLLLAAASVLMLVGLVDDRRGLDWRFRLAAQVLVAAVCVVGRGWKITLFLDLPVLTDALSILWIVALVNAFNMLDNMDGLSAGVAAIAALLLSGVLLTTPAEQSGPQLFVAGLLFVVAGSALGFLVHNRPPARLFMGDAGSYFVGFLIAVATMLATYSNYDQSARHAVFAPLCVMAVPLYDMLSVMWIRFRAGRSLFAADRRHLSHRLVNLGLSRSKAVMTIYLLTLVSGLGALLLPRVDALGAVVVLLLVLAVLALVAVLESAAAGRAGDS